MRLNWMMAASLLTLAGCTVSPTTVRCQRGYTAAANAACLKDNVTQRSRLETGDNNYVAQHPPIDLLDNHYNLEMWSH